MFEFNVFVRADFSPQTFTQKLELGIITGSKGIVYLEFLSNQQLCLFIILAGIIHCEVLVLEVEVLGTEHFL